MNKKVLIPSFRIVTRVASASIMAMMLTGCSTDAFRVSSPFSNPFARGTDNSATGTIKPRHIYHPAPVARDSAIQSRPLSAPTQKIAGNDYHYTAPKPHNYEPSVPKKSHEDFKPHEDFQAARSTSGAGRSGHWSAEGGTPIVVATGESAALLSTRYGIPEVDLLRVNGITSATQVQPGSRMVIPVYNGKVAQNQSSEPKRPTKNEPKMASVAPAHRPEAITRAERATKNRTPSGKHLVPEKVSEMNAKHGRAPHLPLAKESAEVNAAQSKVASHGRAPRSLNEQQADLQNHRKLKTAKIEEKKTKLTPRRVAEAPHPKAKVEDDAQQTAAIAPAAKVDETPTASLPVHTASADEKMRWPARGRIIRGFAPGQNDGINIAVPDGTSVHAVDGGVVAYAGSELKGYGNLVLIRHPNGFVSAYANNGAIEVKRGQTVTRGQVIAKSGQSGNVSSPQLHFELRKGSTPVNPTHFLASL